MSGEWKPAAARGWPQASQHSTEGDVAHRPLAISTGDPAGVGPLIAVRTALEYAAAVPVVLVGSGAQIREIAGDNARALQPLTPDEEWRLQPGSIGIVDVGDVAPGVSSARAATPQGGAHQLRALDVAIDAVLARRARALVTAPMSKAAVVRSGYAFTGHTEHLAMRAGMGIDDVTMMFWGPRLRVALVTTHCSLREAPDRITQARVVRTIRHLAQAFKRLHPGVRAQIVVTGLNPHAGESGVLGSEEIDVITPAIRACEATPDCGPSVVQLRGPTPAETAFRLAAGSNFTGVVAMIHDQATIASKLLDWEQAVNVTWGLPFVRTSVDHGVAYDAVGTPSVSHAGMSSAFELACRLSSS